MSWPFSPAATNLRYLTKARPCALVFEVASKNFFRRDWISCRGLVVGFLCRRTQVEIWSWGGGGGVGRAEIIAVSKSFSIFPNGNVFEVDENVLTSEDKRALERTGVHQPAVRASQQRTSVES